MLRSYTHLQSIVTFDRLKNKKSIIGYADSLYSGELSCTKVFFMCCFTTLLLEMANVALKSVVRSAESGLSNTFNARFLLKYIIALFFIRLGFE